ncbi:LuxR family transcriptional regulator [Streptomyces shenzhenensis]|uniref:LuxR family transcriptional regulator n=1 Tax=Streptomyces shenzhenensis TaxID=943815 RepID=A0A3M0IPY9_9ACTN|nr:LuxR family transcriptional regulator [Streptomyces shenzhenensis]RMB84156.1 LuxR family transcriptional regulator [Streptomyces shenzhenensis]
MVHELPDAFPAAGGGVPFLGRAEELAVLRSVVDRAEAGHGGALAVRGEAGVGKTSLLREAANAVVGARVSRVAAIESESDLQYAGLQLLLSPFLHGLPALPAPQRLALTTAFGMESGSPPQRFLIGLAALSLLADAAAGGTVVCVVDDAHWLDRESADALAFVARRVASHRIALLFGVRDTEAPDSLFADTPELRLEGLPADVARRLLGGVRLDDRVADRLVSGTRGNPLALLELTRELTAGQLSGAVALPDPLPVGRHLEEVFRKRLGKVPPDTRTLLLVAAAETSGDAHLVWQAANRLGAGRAAAVAAEESGFLVLSSGIVFRHPLMRSAVYHGASPQERRLVHEALAAEDDDRERRVWHRALAALHPDEDIARDLEQAAGRAVARGGYAATARLLNRAVQLTTDESRRPGRLLAAARATLDSGNPSGADTLLQQATPLLSPGTGRADRLRLLASIRFAQGQVRETVPLLLEAAELLLRHDERAARDTLFQAMEVATWTGKADMMAVARVVRTLEPVDPDTASPVDLLTAALTARLLDGYEAAYPLYRRCTRSLLATEDLRGFNLGSIAASEMWDLDGLLALTSRWIELARAQGAHGALSLALLLRAIPELWRGNYAAAREFGQTSADLSDLTTGQQGRTGSGIELLYCMTGPERATRETAAAHVREATASGREHYGTLVPRLALCQLEVGLGNYPAAVTHGLRVFTADTLGPTCANVLPELIEAAQRSGDTSTAQAALERLRTAATASGTPLALGLLARSQALVARDDEAEEHYHEAIRQLESSAARPQAARAHLVHGEWLRRQRRRREARDSLRTAHELFDAMGADFYARRARIELAAAGERLPFAEADAAARLTPQEARIARLASTGVPNRDIAAQLFISPSTVEYHLRKTFRKLGVTSRGQLRDALAAHGVPEDSM